MTVRVSSLFNFFFALSSYFLANETNMTLDCFEHTKKKTIANKVDPLENEIRELSYQIEDIKNEQEYTLAREKTHRNSTWLSGDALRIDAMEDVSESNAMFCFHTF